MSYKIGVFGSASSASDEEIREKAKKLGRAIAKSGCILTSGGCEGLPYAASKEAHKNNGKTLAYSSAKDVKKHKETFSLSEDIFSDYVFVPKDFPYSSNRPVCLKYRNVISCSQSDAGIIISGRMGTLNEFTNLYDFGKVIGVLEKTGGVSDMLRELVTAVNKKSNAEVIYDDNPERLVKKVVEAIKKRRKNETAI
ncbi:hypothetical protein C4544_00475 [candidate division WS5 bacterium]|uniref:TIGR00725 family protein n=1 Tax=candidate division WS5 bacterium TaxID=2093353 RepID=A0A419DGV2_9BACT|nr:MAG: hypothetical protein C4544_00475 [candidate division WS5 bacterium]